MTRAEGENEESPPLAEPDDEPSEQVECGEHGAGEQRPGEQQTGEPRAQNPSPTTLRREAIAVAAIILSVVGFIVVKRARRALDDQKPKLEDYALVDVPAAELASAWVGANLGFWYSGGVVVSVCSRVSGLGRGA